MTGCRVPQVVKEHRTARLLGGHIINADDLKKLTTESLKELAALLKQGRSERLTTLLKTMGRPGTMSQERQISSERPRLRPAAPEWPVRPAIRRVAKRAAGGKRAPLPRDGKEIAKVIPVEHRCPRGAI